jgi:predicted lipoprotein with Yx(FWY)xxD motif
MKRHLQFASCALGVLVATACSSGAAGGYQKSATPEGSASAPASGAPVNTAGLAGITTAQNALGTILTDTRGRAVYLFEADKGPTSTCTGGCVQAWPPLTTKGAPIAGAGVNAALLATSPRPDGTMQLTYNGHPLYYYDDDHGPGTTAGQGESSFGANWYLLTPAGLKIDAD